MLAIDPSSPITGGAILGDRIRMQEHAGDSDVFIRSMASRGHPGGLAAASVDAAAALDAAGFPIVFLETVGAGQSEVEVASIADTTVVVEAPDMGDEVQAIKAGLLEVADIVVVTKGDRPGAQRTAAQLRAMLTVGTADDAEATRRAAARGRRRPKRPQVLLVTAPTGAESPTCSRRSTGGLRVATRRPCALRGSLARLRSSTPLWPSACADGYGRLGTAARSMRWCTPSLGTRSIRMRQPTGSWACSTARPGWRSAACRCSTLRLDEHQGGPRLRRGA